MRPPTTRQALPTNRSATVAPDPTPKLCASLSIDEERWAAGASSHLAWAGADVCAALGLGHRGPPCRGPSVPTHRARHEKAAARRAPNQLLQIHPAPLTPSSSSPRCSACLDRRPPATERGEGGREAGRGAGVSGGRLLGGTSAAGARRDATARASAVANHQGGRRASAPGLISSPAPRAPTPLTSSWSSSSSWSPARIHLQSSSSRAHATPYLLST